jgi:hypothetical protein
MNDFERKLSQQPFRTPPPEWRDAILNVSANVIVPGTWTWRNWLWPSPKAWAALAALWMICAAVGLQSDGTPSVENSVTQQPAGGATLLAFHQAQSLNYGIDPSN